MTAQRLPHGREAITEELECAECGEALITDDGEPRACACVRDAEAEHRWEMDDGR